MTPSLRDSSRPTVTPPTILITGGAGFLGSHLTRSLLAQGYNVIGVDNFSTGRPESVSPWRDNPHYVFVEADVTDPGLEKRIGDRPLQAVYHLACPTGVPNIATMSVEMLMTSSIGTKHVLDIARRHGAKIVFTSSCEVYGHPQVSPQHEDYFGHVNPVGPRSPYEEGKRFAEAMVAAYGRRHRLPFSIVRLFNVYGPGMSSKDHRVIPQFLNQLTQGQPLRIYGDGSQIRTLTYVDDVVAALQVVMAKGVTGEVYNIGSTDTVTIRELAEMLIALRRHAPGMDFAPHFIEDHLHRKPDLTKINRLGWQPHTSLAEGLQRLFADEPQVASRFIDLVPAAEQVSVGTP